MNTFEPVIRHLLPKASDTQVYYLESDVESVERGLRKIQHDVSRALEGLTTAKNPDASLQDRAHGIATILDFARSAGASGPIGSQWERIIVDTAKIDTRMQTLRAVQYEGNELEFGVEADGYVVKVDWLLSVEGARAYTKQQGQATFSRKPGSVEWTEVAR